MFEIFQLLKVRKKGFILVIILLLNLQTTNLATGVGRTNEMDNIMTIEILYPHVIYSTFLGGSNDEYGHGIAADKEGNYYLIGTTLSSNFPTLNAFDNFYNSGDYADVFITKFSANDSLLWSTYLGGNDNDWGYAIAVATDGSCYITGKTYSYDFPTLNAYNNTFGGSSVYDGDAFVAKFSINGSLLWSTYLGGRRGEIGYDIGVASDGSCYVIGKTYSSNFPTLNTNYTYRGDWDVFITKFTTNGSLLWSSYLGGYDEDSGHGIAVANDGSFYVTGYTNSINFPIKNAYDSCLNGEFNLTDAFITKFSSNGSLLWSTYYGGDMFEFGYDIATDTEGNCCYVTGETDSYNFPIKNAFDNTLNEYSDIFISKFSSRGALIWSTFLGGSGMENGETIIVSSTDGCCYVTGWTCSSDFPVKNAYDYSFSGDFLFIADAFITKFHANGSLLWSTYLGGNNDDRGYGITLINDNSCYLTGYTTSSDFPTLNAFDNTTEGSKDVFVTKFLESTTPLPSPTPQVTVYSFLTFLVTMPIFVFLLRKRKN